MERIGTRLAASGFASLYCPGMVVFARANELRRRGRRVEDGWWPGAWAAC